MAKLATYPKWKIQKIDEFSGYFSGLWAFLENIDSHQTETYTPPQEDIGYQKQLPDRQENSRLEKECGKKLLDGLVKIMRDEDEKHPKQSISLLHKKLREEYPQFAHNLTC